MSAQFKASHRRKKVHLRRYTVAYIRKVMCPKHACSMHRSGGLELVDQMQAIFGHNGYSNESRRNYV
jgi:hypothetical protein